MHTCMSQRNINSTAYKILTITQFILFLLVSNSYVFFKIEEFSFFKKKMFLIIVLKYIHYFT